MGTNFPLGFDTLGAAGTLGGPFIDAAPPVDLFVDIAADFRSNTNDAMLAVQSRIGLTDSTNPGSLSWATISVGAVNNLGLRFAQDQTEWPGTVGESGIFLKDATLEPMFHRAGEAKATFYPLLGGGGGGTLQDAYDASADPAYITISGAKHLLFQTSPTGVFAFVDSASTYSFLTLNEATSTVYIGDGTDAYISMDGRIVSDLQFDGISRSISNNNANLTLATAGTGNILINPVGTLSVLTGAHCQFDVTAKFEVTGGTISLTSDVGEIDFFSESFIDIRTGGIAGERMRVLTGNVDPSSVAQWAYRGSLFLRDSGVVGELYVKQDDGSSTNWTLLGSGGGGGTLQDAYDASGSPAKILMTGTKDIQFNTHSIGASFIVSDQADANIFIKADESSGDMTLGSGIIYTLNMSGRISSNIQFDGASRTILNTGPLTISVAGMAPLDMSLLASGILTLSGQTIDVRSGGGSGEIMNLVTGTTDPTSVAATGTRGSLYLRDSGVVGELYVKQDNGSSTNWTQLGTGGGGTLQDAYDAGNTIVTAGGNDLSISGSEDFFWENVAANKFRLGAGVTPSVDTGGMVRVSHIAGADGVMAVNCNTGNLAGNPGWEFGAFKATVTDLSDLDDTDVIYAYQANLNMLGDGPGSGSSIGVAFHANEAAFTGANSHVNIALMVEASYDAWLYSKTGAARIDFASDSENYFISTAGIPGGVKANSGDYSWLVKLGSVGATFFHAATILESTGSGGDQLGGTCSTWQTSSSLADGSNPLVGVGPAFLTSIKLDHRTDATDGGTAWHQGMEFTAQIPSSGGGGVNDQGSSIVGVIVSVPESIASSDGLYHNNDGTFGFNRWAIYVEAGESHLRRTEFTSTLDLGKALIRLDQNDDDKPFYELEGRWDLTPTLPDCNFADNDTGGIVVGPKDGKWNWLGMYQVYVIDVSGHIPSGHYWVPLYEAI